MTTDIIFDQPYPKSYVLARQKLLEEFLPPLKRQMNLRTALDLGCGVGYFSAFLHDLGFEVTGIDGRAENIEEARRRHSSVRFKTDNVEDPALAQMGSFDMVLCVGLLYHLENPFIALRNMHALTSGLMVLETMCIPENRVVLALRDEDVARDQGLKYIAFYPSEKCVVKMLYRAGFPYVYRFKVFPDHKEFRATLWTRRIRTMLACSKSPINAAELVLVSEPGPERDPWATQLFRLRHFCSRLKHRLLRV